MIKFAIATVVLAGVLLAAPVTKPAQALPGLGSAVVKPDGTTSVRWRWRHHRRIIGFYGGHRRWRHHHYDYPYYGYSNYGYRPWRSRYYDYPYYGYSDYGYRRHRWRRAGIYLSLPGIRLRFGHRRYRW